MASWNRNVSMRALRAFCAAAQRESFRVAAEDLFLTASAVSHQVRQLESALGVQLFARTPRSLRITEEGKALLDDLRPVLCELDEVVERHSESAGNTVLRLSVQPFFASELLVPKLSEFVAHNPDISITVDTTDVEADRHDRTADVSVRLFSSPPEGLASDRLFSLRLIPVGTPAFYDSIDVVAGRIRSDFPIIMHDSRPKAWQRWQKTSGISLPRNPTVIRLNSMISVARAAEQGLGAALVPAQLCSASIRSGALVQLFDQELESKEAYYIICSDEAPGKQHMRTFRDWVLQEFALD